MGHTMDAARTRGLGVLGLVATVALACGTDDDAGGADGDELVAEAADDGTPTATEDATEVTDDGAEADGEGAEDAAADDEAPARVLEASDGWSEVGDVDLPPGTGELTIDGVTYPFDADCRGFGEVPDHVMDHNTPMNEFVLFNLALNGTGQSDDGHYRVTVERSIHIAGDRYLNLQHAGYGGDGQIDLVSFSPPTEGVARVQTPSSSDPDGDLLPLVQVDPSGSVTAEGTLELEFETDVAPEGDFTLEARCQDGWPDDIIDAAR